MRLFAPAKINLGLSVLGKMPDGYHRIHTVFAALDVGDELEVEPTPGGIKLEVVGAGLSAGPDNLVHRAAQAYLAAAGISSGVRMVLHKNLPLAAGLGGGSSDAAAALRALSEIYPTDVDLGQIALKLGADVPFFLGPGLAEGRGIGEELYPLPPLSAHVVLMNPGVAVAAASAYKNLGVEEWQSGLDVTGILEAVRAGQEPPYWNTLERPVFRLEPRLEELKLELRQAGLFGVLMSGSGSTLFGLAKSADLAQEAAGRLSNRFPLFWVRACGT